MEKTEKKERKEKGSRKRDEPIMLSAIQRQFFLSSLAPIPFVTLFHFSAIQNLTKQKFASSSRNNAYRSSH